MNRWKVITFTSGGGGYYKQYRGFSTWEKPTKTPELGDELIEIDTRNCFMFDGTEWREI